MSENIECVVEYEYSAEQPDELTLRVGDVITNVDKLEGGWWKGTLRGITGMFPDNFVKVLPGGGSVHPMKGEDEGSKTKPRCKVLFSYTPAHEDELALEVDEKIEYICEVEDGWWKGRSKGRVGVFPSNFVEMCNTDCDNKPSHAVTVQEKNKKNSLGLNNSVFSGSESDKMDSPSTLTGKKNSNSSMATSERQLRNTGAAPDTAPRLPPKPVKEQCLVLFPYTAQNEDELTLDEGQIISIVTRDVEDKGWWKGELDGRVGVFPDNFVKLLPPEIEEDKDKRPGRPPTSIIEQLNSNNKSTGLGSSSQLRRSSSQLKPAPGEIESLKPVFNEKLSKKGSDIFKKSNSNLSDKKTVVKNGTGGSSSSPVQPLTGPANHSPVRTKSPAPVKPVPSDKGTSAEAESIQVMEVKDDVESSETDCMWKPGVPEASKLHSVTSTRVKAPKRRPPSSIFLKENIPGLEELMVDSEDEIRPKEVTEENEDTTASVKLRDKAEKVGVPVLQGREDTRDTGSKPSWLEELSRKQANRKSGIFTEDKKPDLPSPEIKPILPTKPSDTRKSLGSFIRRPGSFTDKDTASDNSSETKDKPVRPAFPPSMPKAASSSTLPDRPESDHSTDRQTKSTEKRSAGRKSSETKKELTSSEQEQEKSEAARKLAEFTNRLSEAGRFGNNKQSEPSKKVQDLNPKQSESGNKQPDVSRKHSDTTKGFESSKPSVHSTNLGRPEARSFAAVPERPADFSSPKGGLARRIDNLSRTLDTKQEDPETSSKSEQDRSIGWSNHILKPEPGERSEPEDTRMESSTRSVWSETRIRPETGKPEPSANTQQYQNKVVELERRLESISAEFAGQISALKSQLEKERDRRIDLEAEVASLARLVKSKKQ